MPYNPKEIEPKWQKYWEDNKTFRTEIDLNKEKYYDISSKFLVYNLKREKYVTYRFEQKRIDAQRHFYGKD